VGEIMYRINAMYFSPTGTTKKVITEIISGIKVNIDVSDINIIDFTNFDVRTKPLHFNDDDMLIIGVPVYAGRVPNILLKYLNTVKANKALTVPVVVYGNRNYDDALLELNDILNSNGFRTIAAAAFIGEHSFSNILAEKRPDEVDIKAIKEFGGKIALRIKNNDIVKSLNIKGNRPYGAYYRPKDKNGNLYDFTKIKPKTNEKCNDCKICVEVCPMNSIDMEQVSLINGICIKCCACVKSCPKEAKYFDDENFLLHKKELETNLIERREPEVFI
jgi:ferredoxin